MRLLATLPALLVLATVPACDAISPERPAPAEPSAQEEVQAVVDVLASAKASGTIVYQGGSLGLEVPRALEHYYTQSGALFVKGTLNEPISNGKTSGVSIAVSPEAEQAFSGKKITIRIVSSAYQPGEAFLAYSTNEVGNSGWVSFPVTTEDSVATITYDVPPMAAGLGDFIGIDPNGNEVTIKAIVVDIQG
jgi:hypothetical protein